MVRCNFMQQVLGVALSVRLRRHAHVSLFRVDIASLPDEGNPTQLILEDLVAAKKEIATLINARDSRMHIVDEAGVKQLANTWTPKDEQRRSVCDMATATLRWALDCRVFFRQAPQTIAEAEMLMREARGEVQVHDALDRLVSRTTLGKHAVLLDDVLDSVLRDQIAEARGSSYFGFAFASDESPPAGSRFSGFRFQISQLYIPWFEPASRWDAP
eukprot:1345132-Pyramimonas_sp.AAC.1